MTDTILDQLAAVLRETATNANRWCAALDRMTGETRSDHELIVLLHQCGRDMAIAAAEIDRLRAAQSEAASILAAILERARARKGTADEGRVMGLEWYRYKHAIRLLTGEEE